MIPEGLSKVNGLEVLRGHMCLQGLLPMPLLAVSQYVPFLQLSIGENSQDVPRKLRVFLHGLLKVESVAGTPPMPTIVP